MKNRNIKFMGILLVLACLAVSPAVATPGYFYFDGGWGYAMHSNVSGATHVGSLTLNRYGSYVTGAFAAFDRSNPFVDGSYDPITGTLTLSRDTGLETIQTFILRRVGGKLTGTFRNRGRYSDFGTIELWRMTL